MRRYYAGFRGWSTVVMDTLPEAGGQITAMYPEKDIFDVAGFPAIKGRVCSSRPSSSRRRRSSRRTCSATRR